MNVVRDQWSCRVESLKMSLWPKESVRRIVRSNFWISKNAKEKKDVCGGVGEPKTLFMFGCDWKSKISLTARVDNS